MGAGGEPWAGGVGKEKLMVVGVVPLEESFVEVEAEGVRPPEGFGRGRDSGS